jgi:hypothetical protein
VFLASRGKLPILTEADAARKGEWDSEEQGRFPSTSEKEGKRSEGVQFPFPWLVPKKKDGYTKEEEVGTLWTAFSLNENLSSMGQCPMIAV